MSMLNLFMVALLGGLSSLVPAFGAELVGSAWQLHSIQSMDDAQGTTKVVNPSHFTLEFRLDGRASLRLDCNRGIGDYKIEPAENGSSGGLIFGPIAATRALCLQPHLDERIVRDMAYVRSYLLKDGKLFLSLMADGGIYEWAPQHPVTAEVAPNRIVKKVQLEQGKNATTIRGQIVGRQSIDYQLHALAGQRMTIRLQGNNGANYFNLLPPRSTDVALAIGEQIDNHFDGLLPEDGVYTIRVFLYRAAARRNERSRFALSIGINEQAVR